MTDTGSRHERFDGIELLRFVLALSVVVFHYYFWAPHAQLIDYPAGGNALVYLMFGVEAFFAVSGFVIVLSAAGRRPLDFLIARTARLGPTLLVASSITLALYFALDMKPRITGAGLEYVRSVLMFPLARLGSGLDPVLWSLSFEIRFYLVIFVCMWLVDMRRWAFAVGIGMLAYDLARTALPLLTGYPFPSSLDFFKNYASFFVIGMLLYHRHVTGRTGPAWIAALLAAMALAATRATRILTNMYDESLHLGRVHFWEGALIALAILALMALSMRPVRRAALVRIFRVAGRASYPLYVVHGLCGYWILNWCTQHVRLDIDLRPPVVLTMVGLSLAYGNWVEPALIRLYRNAMNDTVGLFAGLWTRRTVRAAPESVTARLT